MRTATSRLCLVGMGLVALFAVGGIGSAESDVISIVLTGQSALQSDFRVHMPEVVPAMAPLLKGDVVFTNFETSVGMKGQTNQNTPGGGSGFHAPPEGLDALMALGFNLISNANNQAWGLGPVGILNTVREAKKRNLTLAGSGATLQDAAAPAYLKTPKGIVALVAMASGAVPEGAAATETRPGVNELRVEADKNVCNASAPCVGARPNEVDAKRILQSIRDAAARADLVIVYQHNHLFPQPYTEIFRHRLPERLVPPDWVKEWSHAEIEAGADLVVLHGPPLLHGVEIYHGRPIFYDQGNFIFQVSTSVSDTFNEDGVWRSTVSRVEFQGKKLRAITFRPYALNKEPREGGDLFIPTRGLPMPASGETAHLVLSQLVELSRPFGTEIEVSGESARVRLR